MLLLSVLLSQAVFATAVPCTLEQALQYPKSPCTQQLAKKIADEQDRAEFKFRMSQWKWPTGLKVYSDHGFIEAQIKGETVVRSIWIKYNDPAILWLNGKVLTDTSKSPSIARTLDKMLRPASTASLLFPEAHAENNDLVKNVVFFYSVAGDDQANRISDSNTAEAVVKSHAPMADFLPAGNPLINWFGGGPTVNCASKNTVEPSNFEVNPGTDELYIRITPKSPTEFILSGIEKGKTHLVTMTAFQLKMGDQSRTILAPKWSFAGATIAECGDVNCNVTEKSRSYQERELIFGHSPEKEKEMDAQRSKAGREEIARINQDRRDRLAAKMFGMSVMGSICDNPIARDELKKNYKVNLVPASNSAPTTR